MVLVGHSIGGAVALLLAGTEPSWPLLGVSVSGCLLQSPPDTAGHVASIPAEWLPCGGDMRIQLMFGPEGTYGSDMPAAEADFHGDTPVLVKELVEIFVGWEERFRHGEFDKLWISDEEQVRRFGQAFTKAPVVDAELWRNVGHDIDHHRAGAAFQTQQLAFALSAAAYVIGRSVTDGPLHR